MKSLKRIRSASRDDPPIDARCCHRTTSANTSVSGRSRSQTLISVRSFLLVLYVSLMDTRSQVGVDGFIGSSQVAAASFAGRYTPRASSSQQPPSFFYDIRKPYRRRTRALYDSETKTEVMEHLSSQTIHINAHATGHLVSLPSAFNDTAHNPPIQIRNDIATRLHDEDIARPTVNGGFTHTTSSKAKISAANRGKTPWNKGKDRSPETKAKIAAGVRARNRQRFLEKLKAMGVTEDEYNLQQKQEEDRKRQATLSRRTEKGGYTPTEETRQKISKILKEKHAKGEVKPRTTDPAKVRRGFTHSDETKRRISESLRRRWATDESYRQAMTEKAQVINTQVGVRSRISQSLKEKWKDEEFRTTMIAKMSNRKSLEGETLDESHRKRISDAMKAKWQDKEYREKTLKSIALRKEANAKLRPPKPPRAPSKPRKSSSRSRSPMGEVLRQLEPRTASQRLQPPAPKRPASKSKIITAGTPSRKVAKATHKTGNHSKATSEEADSLNSLAANDGKEEVTESKKSRPGRKKTDGDVGQLKEDRRDLFDLLYGDEQSFTVNERILSAFDDENLESFDPYGLDNE
jgi:hypothetical protein